MTSDALNFIFDLTITVFLIVRLSVGNLYEGGSLLRIGLLLAVGWFLMNDLDDLLGIQYLPGAFHQWSFFRTGTAKIIVIVSVVLDLSRVYLRRRYHGRIRALAFFARNN